MPRRFYNVNNFGNQLDAFWPFSAAPARLVNLLAFIDWPVRFPLDPEPDTGGTRIFVPAHNRMAELHSPELLRIERVILLRLVVHMSPSRMA